MLRDTRRRPLGRDDIAVRDFLAHGKGTRIDRVLLFEFVGREGSDSQSDLLPQLIRSVFDDFQFRYLAVKSVLVF